MNQDWALLYSLKLLEVGKLYKLVALASQFQLLIVQMTVTRSYGLHQCSWVQHGDITNPGLSRGIMSVAMDVHNHMFLLMGGAEMKGCHTMQNRSSFLSLHPGGGGGGGGEPGNEATCT